VPIANGPDKQIDGGGLAINGRYARVYCQVQPVLIDPNNGVPLANPGTFDARGQYLHIRYEGNLNLGARSGGNQIPGGVLPADYVPNKVVVEFDAQSMFTLPFEGQLSLVGGRGMWKFGWQVVGYGDERDYQEDIRWLSTFKRAASSFTVPDNHTYIMSADPTATVILPTGNPLVPGNLIPGQTIIAGTTVTLGASDNTLKTGWKG
jgi:hypothetical protein